MDRDNRWDRVAKAYDCLTGEDGPKTGRIGLRGGPGLLRQSDRRLTFGR